MALKYPPPQPPDVSPLGLLEHELAQRWRVDKKSLQRWRQEGTGPKFVRISRKIVYPFSEIERYESDRLFQSTSERA